MIYKVIFWIINAKRSAYTDNSLTRMLVRIHPGYSNIPINFHGGLNLPKSIFGNSNAIKGVIQRLMIHING